MTKANTKVRSKLEKNKHNTHSEYCWCNPKTEAMDNGSKVIIHNNIN